MLEELELHRHGLRTIEIDRFASWLGPDGQKITFWCDLERTVAEIAQYSRRDAEQYRRLTTILCDLY